MEYLRSRYKGPSLKSKIIRFFSKENIMLKNADWVFTVMTLGLVFFGFFMVLSAVSFDSIITAKNPAIKAKVIKQIIITLFGFVIMYFFSIMDYRKYSVKLIFSVVSLVLILNVMTMIFGISTLGATRWLGKGLLQFQPSEFAKIILVFFTAQILSLKSDDDKKLGRRYWFLMILVVIFALVILIGQSNLSNTFIICAVYFGQVFISGASLRFILTNIALGAGGLFAGIKFMSYRLKRVTEHTEYLAGGKIPYQLKRSFFAIASGGFFGRGYTNSRMKADWLPIADSDFIFAIICEELGIITGIGLIIYFFLYILRGFKIARGSSDKFGYLLGVGIMLSIFFQVAINISVVTGIAPITGVTLPFISAGGTSLVTNMAYAGMMISISRFSGEKQEGTA